MLLTLSKYELFFLADYVTYPIYFIIYHPWLVRKYKREDHARKEERDDCLIFHSLQAPTAVNITMERHGLDTMDKIFDYVTTVSYAFLSLKNQNPFTPFSFRPTLKMRHWELEKSLEKKMKSNQTARFSSKESNIFAIFFVQGRSTRLGSQGSSPGTF